MFGIFGILTENIANNKSGRTQQSFVDWWLLGGGQGARRRDSSMTSQRRKQRGGRKPENHSRKRCMGSKENKTGAPVFGRKQQQNAHFLKHLTKDFFEISFA